MATGFLKKMQDYPARYSPEFLFSIPRDENRKRLERGTLEFTGYDIWNAYEVSWLNKKGKPEVRMMQLVYSCNSKFIVESKSLKLYLFGFSMTIFHSEEDVLKCIESDLSAILDTPFMEVSFFRPEHHPDYTTFPNEYEIDYLDIETDIYLPDVRVLKRQYCSKHKQFAFSHLLKTNCPITNQPDWGTVYIEQCSDYHLNEESLLRYIISFRNHSGFHEDCCEKIFSDLFIFLSPERLIVKCFFTRRGGIEINPCRFYGVEADNDYGYHMWRQ